MSGITAAVLAGGASRRFGSNKALAPWKGRTLVEAVAGIVAGIFPSSLVVVKDPEAFRFLATPAIRVVQDLHVATHSLGGISSALLHAETEHVFVAGCDMPFLQPGLVEGLAQARHGYDAVIPVWRERLQPLCGIYSRSCRGVIDRLIKDQRLGVHELFGLLRTRFYLEAEIRPLDPEGISFVDLDTREDYERAAGRRKAS